MSDSSHLEKMGRELKCPICLSLLNSAASLTCNHVFCNGCIVKSMKSAYNCPVCKVPYQRREVRPAPHMDNLVSIYKSMELASGLDIFVTQNVPTSKSSDEEKQIEHDPTGGKNIDHIHEDGPENPGTSKRKAGRRKTAKSNLMTSDRILSKPCFPAKKRVHVPLYPPTETTPQHAKVDDELVQSAKDQLANSSADVVKKPNLNETEELALPPFFWLRDKGDEEKSSQETNSEETEYITPPNVPCFSDIKDSDDECPSPTAKVNEKSGRDNFFDSEMFEWTQRACSPELLSTPVKAQGKNNEEFQVGETNEAVRGIAVDDPNTKRANSLDVELGGTSSPVSKEANDQTETAKSKKRGRNAKKMAPRTCGKKEKDTSVTKVNKEKKFENAVKKQTSCSNGGGVDFEKKKKRCQRTKHGIATELVPQCPDLSVTEENLNQNKRRKGKAPILLGNDSAVDANGMNRRADLQPTKQKSDSLKLSSKKKISEEVPTPQNQKTADVMPQVSTLSVPKFSDNRASSFSTLTGKRTKELKSVLSSDHDQETRGRKKRKVSFSGILKYGLVDENQEDSVVSAKETEQVQHNHGHSVTTPGKLPLKSGVTLHKCNTQQKFQCAFCLSSEDSEASGQMVHYHSGKSVASDFNGGSKIIHCHKECTEWAPNVYFENGTAINLEVELNRSRRIKCCCCGLKGAALGCYDKSCRKSFHVPCAKLISQCRWDTDNFVMLCPLHPSAKLPNEIPESHKKMKRISTVKPKIPIKCNQEGIQHDTKITGQWKTGGSSNKLVLCCSALTVEEREIVSEFERLSGTKVLKNWDSSVTHVIASIDENIACKRTLKVLMGILEGKWILSIEWVKACMKVMEPVDEEQYEVTVDTHGIKGGPPRGRSRVQNKQPKLFNGLEFYLMGEFTPSYKGYLHNLIIVAGGSILHRKPITRDQGTLMTGSRTISTFIIHSVEVPDKCDLRKTKTILDRNRTKAEALANSCAAKAVSNSWLLNSIAACKLQSLV